MTQRPNVLLLMADDHRYSAIRACGDPVVRTPVLDSLLGSGVSFDRTYHYGSLVGAVCIPARACLLTGAPPFRSGVSTAVNDSRGVMTLRPELPTLPETFRRAGYHTHHIGKWHNDRASFQRSFTGGDRLFFGGMSDHYRVPVQDFDPTGAYPAEAQYPGDRHSTELFGQAAIDFLRRQPAEQPFYLSVAFTAPHDPRTAPPEYAALYSAADIPLPPNFAPEHPFDNGELRVRDEELAGFPRTPEEVRQHIADYYAMITHLDAWIGKVLDTLRETGRAENTLVVYTADHGLAVGQHGLLGKQNVYEHSVRVPCIMRGPGVPEGQRVDALTYTPDLFPTLCELAGVPPLAPVEAQSLAPLLRGRRESLRPMVGSLYKDVQRMVCDGRWKLIRYYRGASGAGTDRLQLFDLAEDPWELHDLSADAAQRDRITSLLDALGAWQLQVGDPLVSPAPTG